MKGTLDYGLIYRSNRNGNTDLQGCTDADWAGGTASQKLIPEHVF